MKIVATDLDRTLLPNGPHPDDGALPLFKKLITQNQITPIFVTARRLESVQRVLQEYDLPTPEAIIASVGSAIYFRENSQFIAYHDWPTTIQKRAQGWQRESIFEALKSFSELVLQKEEEQNPFKLSYYLYGLEKFETVTPLIMQRVATLCGKDAEITLSKDFNADLTYIDIMPTSVSKLTALQFLQEKMKFTQKQLLFAGDSGNDMTIILSHFDAILVGNAEESLKKKAQQQKKRGKLYLPSGIHGLNGNYTSGILEALVKHDWIKQIDLL